jgi:Indigoidine synthase A like protein
MDRFSPYIFCPFIYIQVLYLYPSSNEVSQKQRRQGGCSGGVFSGNLSGQTRMETWTERVAQLVSQITGGPGTRHGIVVSPEVAKALRNRQPVVALESTIISHGMPYPQNLEMARDVEAIVRAGALLQFTQTNRIRPTQTITCFHLVLGCGRKPSVLRLKAPGL